MFCCEIFCAQAILFPIRQPIPHTITTGKSIAVTPHTIRSPSAAGIIRITAITERIRNRPHASPNKIFRNCHPSHTARIIKQRSNIIFSPSCRSMTESSLADQAMCDKNTARMPAGIPIIRTNTGPQHPHPLRGGGPHGSLRYPQPLRHPRSGGGGGGGPQGLRPPPGGGPYSLLIPYLSLSPADVSPPKIRSAAWPPAPPHRPRPPYLFP